MTKQKNKQKKSAAGTIESIQLFMQRSLFLLFAITVCLYV